MKIKNRFRRRVVVAGVAVPAKYLFILSLLAVATIYVTIETSVIGGKLSELESRRVELTRQNSRISHDLASAESLTNLKEKAVELGFAKPVHVVYLTEVKPIAKLP